MKKSITLPFILGMFFCGNTNASTIPDWISEQDEQFQANYSELYNYCLAVQAQLCPEIECKNSTFEEFSQTLKVDVQNCLYNNNFGIDKNLPLNFFGEYKKKKAEDEKRANQSDEENACQDAQKQCPSLICDFYSTTYAQKSIEDTKACLKNPEDFENKIQIEDDKKYQEHQSLSTAKKNASKDPKISMRNYIRDKYGDNNPDIDINVSGNFYYGVYKTSDGKEINLRFNMRKPYLGTSEF